MANLPATVCFEICYGLPRERSTLAPPTSSPIPLIVVGRRGGRRRSLEDTDIEADHRSLDPIRRLVEVGGPELMTVVTNER